MSFSYIAKISFFSLVLESLAYNNNPSHYDPCWFIISRGGKNRKFWGYLKSNRLDLENLKAALGHRNANCTPLSHVHDITRPLQKSQCCIAMVQSLVHPCLLIWLHQKKLLATAQIIWTSESMQLIMAVNSEQQWVSSSIMKSG